jgi:hypothetical protein
MAGPPQHPAEVPSQPQWVYQPAARTSAVRPVWIMAAGFIIAAAVIIGAVIISRGSTTQTTPTAAPAQGNASQPANPSSLTNAADSPTCVGWRSVQPSLDLIPGLPDGWDWDTPNIDRTIAERNAEINKVLDIFEPLISDQPADLAKIAHTFVDGRRNETRLLAAHTFQGSDGVAGNVAYTQLNQQCGVSP